MVLSVLQVISGPLLSAMFECGGVRLPDRRGTITVYRGGQDDLEAVRRGWSWTTRRGVAAWFARRFPQPLVIEARVRPVRILHACDERDEHEVVIAGGARRAAVSGTPDAWMAEATEWRMSLSEAE